MFWTSQFFGKKEKKEKEFVPSAAANDGIWRQCAQFYAWKSDANATFLRKWKNTQI
jgi:hypothetical protein